MIDRILDFSTSPARLQVRYRQLLVDRPEQPQASVPLADLAVIVVAHPQVTYTQAVLSGLAEAGGAFVACNRQHLPVGMFLPLAAHFSQTERFVAQAAAKRPLCKRLWQQLVRAKIAAQAACLEGLYGADMGLHELIPLVRSGDPANVEARAARRYWGHLFVETEFRRDRDREDENLLLNYGYAVLRAIIARAICAAGLHPSLGVHHRNRYNAFCLADDLMEPFRPTVDRAVVEYVSANDAIYRLEAAAKRHLIEAITERCELAGQQETIFTAASRLCSSLVECYLGRSDRLLLPEW